MTLMIQRRAAEPRVMPHRRKKWNFRRLIQVHGFTRIASDSAKMPPRFAKYVHFVPGLKSKKRSGITSVCNRSGKAAFLRVARYSRRSVETQSVMQMAGG